MLIRKATAEEMIKLWGYDDVAASSPTAQYFYRNIASGNAVFWAVDDEGQLIGELYAFLNLDDKDFADGTSTAYLCAFRIQMEHRGKGLGSQLMSAVLSDLKERGFIYATIGVDDERNRRLYGRLGFTETVKTCHHDPCAMNDKMQPEHVKNGFVLLRKLMFYH